MDKNFYVKIEQAEIVPTEEIGIPCLLCGKVLESCDFVPPIYICDECKEAVAYAKQLKTKAERHDPLKAILD